jgi:DnaK suppressor protein
MDDQRARLLLRDERGRVEGLLGDVATAGRDDRSGENEQGDIDDPAASLTAEGLDNAVEVGLRDRLAALDRAERRLAEGTYGLSIRSGEPIPDERLEADPAAELTIGEAEQR